MTGVQTCALPIFVDYAADRGITIIPGFHWGWGKEGLDISKPADRTRIATDAAEMFKRDYAGRGFRSIYFQTLTEHTTREINGETVAALAAKLVNEAAVEIWKIQPNIEIQFGLHALSIGDRYNDLKTLDDRIVIVWEDAGNLPFAYDPTALPAASWLKDISGVDATLEYAKSLASFRPGTPFAMVPKGWTKLSWSNEFENHGQFILGERSAEFIRRRRDLIQSRWDYVDRHWFEYYPLAVKFYSEILNISKSGILAAGLVEDGVIEAGVPSSVALFAEMIWNPKREPGDILRNAMSSFYRG